MAFVSPIWPPTGRTESECGFERTYQHIKKLNGKTTRTNSG